MSKLTRLAVLTKLNELQGNCSPIEVSIGSVDKGNHVQNNTLVIKDCAPKVIEEMVDMCSYKMDMHDGGLHIMCDDEEDGVKESPKCISNEDLVLVSMYVYRLKDSMEQLDKVVAEEIVPVVLSHYFDWCNWLSRRDYVEFAYNDIEEYWGGVLTTHFRKLFR